MKKIVVTTALIFSLVIPNQAQAAETKFAGGPLTNLDSTAATIHIALSNFPSKGGLYIQECVEGVSGARPTLCNPAVQLWISTSPGASFAPNADIVFKPTGNFNAGATAVDCTVSKCGIFMRYDHTVPGDLSEDQFIPLTFKASSGGSNTLPADEVTATVNGVGVSMKAPITLGYRQVSTLAAISKAGATLSFASRDANCALAGNKITPLKGSGECVIYVTSAGNEAAAGATVIVPITLTLGVQTIPTIAAKKSIKLAGITNLGQRVKYSTSGSCSVKKNVVTAKKGKCTVQAHADGIAGLFAKLHKKTVLNIK
jgi:hypothetical protein